jgi:DNA ligase-1
MDIARVQGKNTQRNKIGMISNLLTLAHGEEAKFLVRSCSGSLRIGCAQSSLLMGIGAGFRLREYYMKVVKHASSETELIDYGKKFKKLYHRCPLLDELVVQMLQSGKTLDSMDKKFHLTVGIPVLPMLAKPAKSTDEIKKRMDDAELTCEYKYDGERAQIHRKPDGTVQIFSRNVKEMTPQYKDIIPLILEHVDAESFIIDSEVVAYDVEKQIILPFQTLMHRSRKGTDEVSPIQVCIFAFDLIYVDGEWLDSRPLFERRSELHRIVKPVEGQFQTAKYLDTDIDHMREFFDEAVTNRTEGLMIKVRDSVYEPGKRSQHWAKLKKDYVKGFGTAEESSVSDSFDVVVVGATMGKGKRAGLYGAYLVAVWNEDCGRFQTICEVGTGFSDQVLADFTEFFKTKVVERPPSGVQYGKSSPQFYIEPTVVWEIGAADITVSPTSACCWGDVQDNAGISLRFGRFQRVREDKEPRHCTSAHQVLEMYNDQPGISK